MSTDSEAWLTLAAHLAAAPIPRWMLEDARAVTFLQAARSRFGAPAEIATPDPAAVLAALQQSGRAQVDATSITVLSEVRKSILDGVSTEEVRAWTRIALDYVYAFAPMNADDPTTWGQWRDLEPHVRHVIDLAAPFGIAFPTARLMGEGLGVFMYLIGATDEALQLFRRALEMSEAHFGADAPEIAADLNNLAFALRECGEPAKADELLTRALQILAAHEQDHRASFAVVVGNMADMLHRMGRNDEAEALYRRAVAVEIGRGNDERTIPGIHLRKLAAFLNATGRRQEAADTLRRALATDEQLLGPDHPNVSLDLGDLVAVEDGAADARALIPLLRRALEIDSRTFTAGHAAVIAGRLRLASLCLRAGDTVAAGDVLAEITELPDEALIPLGESVCDALLELVRIRERQARVEEAIGVALRLLRLLEAAVPTPAARLMEIRTTIPALLIRAGRAAEARLFALDTSERELRQRVASNPRDIDALNRLGILLKNERGDYEGAEKCYRDALAADSANAQAWNNLAVLLGAAWGRYEEAEAAYRRSLELDPADPNTLANYALLVQNEHHDFTVAAGLYRMALETGRADAGAHANFAGLTMCMGGCAAAVDLLQKAWELQAGHHDRSSARILFLRAAVEALEGRTHRLFLGQLRTLFETGIGHSPWPNRSILQTLESRLQPEEAGLFRALSGAIDSRSSAEEFARSGGWTRIPAVALDVSWDTLMEV